jgi:cation diffusion facilitator family transporter
VLLRPLVCTAVGMAGNLVLTVGKLIIGFASNSASLVADGAHSFSDLASDVGIVIALKAGARPPDRNHPYGHHNYETLGALGASLLLLGTGIVLGRAAFENLLAGVSTVPGQAALVAALISILAKEVMARYTFLAGRRHNSPALNTNAAHHRSDALSSLAAVIGIAGARWGAPWLDSAAALFIAAWIVLMGWQLLKGNTDILMETRPSDRFVSQVRRAALEVPDVKAVTFLVVRPRGSVYLADISIAVQPDMTVAEGHELAHAVEDALRQKIRRLIGVTVHVEPHEG